MLGAVTKAGDPAINLEVPHKGYSVGTIANIIAERHSNQSKGKLGAVPIADAVSLCPVILSRRRRVDPRGEKQK